MHKNEAMKKIHYKNLLYRHVIKETIYWRNKDTFTGMNKNYSDFYFKERTQRMTL